MLKALSIKVFGLKLVFNLNIKMLGNNYQQIFLWKIYKIISDQ